MTLTGTGAYEAMRAHHQNLSERLASRAAAVSEAVAAGRPHEAAVTDLIAYLAEEVLPHAAAEEETVYLAAAAHDDLIGTVNEMAAEHAALSAAAGTLAEVTDGRAAAEQARQVAELFAEHAAREDEVLLPALLADDEVDPAALLAQLHRRAGDAAKSAPGADMDGRDLQGALLGLLLEAATALARAGQAGLGSRLAAAAWALLREDRPDLAVAATAALHRLAHRADDPAPDGQPAGSGESAAGSGRRAGERDLDVRTFPPAQRHEAIFAAYRDLAPGAGFLLVNDHDPKPLRYQFEAEHAGEFTWDYLESGPEEWRVRISRPKA